VSSPNALANVANLALADLALASQVCT
jgi:hypothetical protein